jgi:hypothetical protein
MSGPVIRFTMPEPKVEGTGTVTPPATPQRASFDFHYAEFLSRGLSEDEAARLARAVVARDDTSPKE